MKRDDKYIVDFVLDELSNSEREEFEKQMHDSSVEEEVKDMQNFVSFLQDEIQKEETLTCKKVVIRNRSKYYFFSSVALAASIVIVALLLDGRNHIDVTSSSVNVSIDEQAVNANNQIPASSFIIGDTERNYTDQRRFALGERSDSFAISKMSDFEYNYSHPSYEVLSDSLSLVDDLSQDSRLSAKGYKEIRLATTSNSATYTDKLDGAKSTQSSIKELAKPTNTSRNLRFNQVAQHNYKMISLIYDKSTSDDVFVTHEDKDSFSIIDDKADENAKFTFIPNVFKSPIDDTIKLHVSIKTDNLMINKLKPQNIMFVLSYENKEKLITSLESLKQQIAELQQKIADNDKLVFVLYRGNSVLGKKEFSSKDSFATIQKKLLGKKSLVKVKKFNINYKENGICIVDDKDALQKLKKNSFVKIINEYNKENRLIQLVSNSEENNNLSLFGKAKIFFNFEKPKVADSKKMIDKVGKVLSLQNEQINLVFDFNENTISQVNKSISFDNQKKALPKNVNHYKVYDLSLNEKLDKTQELFSMTINHVDSNNKIKQITKENKSVADIQEFATLSDEIKKEYLTFEVTNLMKQEKFVDNKKIYQELYDCIIKYELDKKDKAMEGIALMLKNIL